MNPGVSEEAGKTARGLIDALKEQPSMLALVFANMMMLIFLFYMQHSNLKAWEQVNTYRVEVGQEMFKYVTETSRLLAQCSTIPAEQVPKPPQVSPK